MHNFRWWDEKNQEFKVSQVGKWHHVWPEHEKIIQLGSGLLDKNGVEIFEGDIVEVYVRAYEEVVIDSIVFGCGCFCLEKAFLRYESTYWDTENFTVIGNTKQGILK